MITRKSIIGDILKSNPNSLEIFFNAGLHCMGCSGALFESIEDGCKAHGLGDKDIEELLKKLNRKKG